MDILAFTLLVTAAAYMLLGAEPSLASRAVRGAIGTVLWLVESVRFER
jgi:hypothetical protein